MEWTRLDLRKASVLRKEVDLAVRLLTRATTEGEDPAKVAELVESVQNRIREIEEFYTQNDDDERSILFEKQRLRLRRAIQSVSVGKKSDATPSRPSAISIADPPATPASAVAPRKDSSSALRGSPGAKPSGRGAVTASRTPPASASKSLQPIYNWEMANQSAGDSDADVVRERITTEAASFIPSNSLGIYVGDASSDSFAADALVDFQVVLSEEEFNVFVARRRNVVAEKKHSERFLDKSKPGDKSTVLASTPYVDPKRIQRELLRPPQPHKWVNQSGFRPTGSKIQ